MTLSYTLLYVFVTSKTKMASTIPKRYMKTYSDVHRKSKAGKVDFQSNFVLSKNPVTNKPIVESKILSTKRALELLLEGSLQNKVCRFCLNIASPLSELDQVFHVVGKGGILYKVTIRDMIIIFHPFKMVEDTNFPGKICNKCIDSTISAYLFSQQCERAERAIKNCYEDILLKVDKLDSMDQPKKRGRQKQNPNYNKIYLENKQVIDYAEPIINMINRGALTQNRQSTVQINKLECLKCSEILPNIESLLNHESIHPSTMWYHCRYCGKSFPKRNLVKKHLRNVHIEKEVTSQKNIKDSFTCLDCGHCSEDYFTHLQHVEKHKFQDALQCILNKRTDNLCTVCLSKGRKVTDLAKTVNLHGGYPEVTGEKSLYAILDAMLSMRNAQHDYISSKICEQCLTFSISAYLFVNNSAYIRYRVNTCITQMLQQLEPLDDPNCTVLIQVANCIIMPPQSAQLAHQCLFGDNQQVDESKLNVEVLEDEFRIKSDNEESTSSEESATAAAGDTRLFDELLNDDTIIEPQAKLPNGFENKTITNNMKYSYRVDDVCKEFLTFKNKNKPAKRIDKYTCPLCGKRFVSGYYLKRHVLKHLHEKVKCLTCGMTFQSRFVLFEHKRMAHVLEQPSCESCDVCGRAFTFRHKMNIHLGTHSFKQCQLCDKSFKTQKHFDIHLRRHAAAAAAARAPVSDIHKTRHSRPRPHQDAAASLPLHFNEAHFHMKPYSCDMCERQFNSESNLRDHKKVHSMAAKEVCVLCDAVLKCRKQLVAHIRKHIGVEPRALRSPREVARVARLLHSRS